MEIMVKAFEIAGYDEETLQKKFGALYNAFQFGAPPHGESCQLHKFLFQIFRNKLIDRAFQMYLQSVRKCLAQLLKRLHRREVR